MTAIRVDAFLRCAIRDGSPYRDEARVILPDGTIRDVVHGARVERGPGGEIVAVAGFFHDITERNDAQR